MKIDEGDIRIYYKAKGGVDPDLEKFFRLLLKLMGYQFFKAGTDSENCSYTGTEDLWFAKK